MKYIDADTLRAGIESICLFPQKSADYNDGREDMKMMVFDLIDSLQQEQPEIFDTVAFQKGVQEGRRLEREDPVSDCHDLTEAAEKYADGPECSWVGTSALEQAFKAGAEWQKAKMMDEWLKDRDGCFWDGVNEGKKAMKEQMMEGAVAVEVVGEKRDLRLIDSTQRCLFDAKRGDWLKIIIVKEGEQ